ncbi:MAG: hypothetical protein JSW27_13830, partial [Phycisphaerales bacterium]
KDGVVAFWSAIPQPKEEMPRLIPLGPSNRAQPVFAPKSRVLTVPREGTVSLFDLATFSETELSELGTDVSMVAYSPDGILLVSGGANGRIRVWSCTERRLLKELDDHKAQIILLRFQADGKRLFSLDATGEAIWWDALMWQPDRTFVARLLSGGMGHRVDVSPDGRLLAFGARGALQWLSAETGELLATSTGTHMVAATRVVFSNDGLRVASTYNYGTVALWDASSFGLETAFRGHLLGACGAAFSPDGRRLVSSGTGLDAVKLWDSLSHRELITLPGESILREVAFSPDSSWLAACNREGTLHLWHAPSWEEIDAEERRLKGEPSP